MAGLVEGSLASSSPAREATLRARARVYRLSVSVIECDHAVDRSRARACEHRVGVLLYVRRSQR